MNKLKRAKIAFYTELGIGIAEILGYLALLFIGFFDPEKGGIPLLRYGFLAVILITAFVAFSGAIKFSSAKILLDELTIENTYNLSRKSDFYNFHALLRKVKDLKTGRFKNKPAYVLAFSPSNTSVTKAAAQNSVVAILNGEISEYIAKFFDSHGRKVKQSNVYCFYHGFFIIYSFLNTEFIEHFINDMSTDLFKIVEEKQIHVYVQPFFGITEVINPRETISMSIDNAITALRFSEKNFEEKTYYDERLVRTVTEDDIKEIEQAMKDKEFIVYYQPKFSLKTNEVVSSEALIRWNSPKYGFSGPDKFLPKAEAGGIMHEIDMYVFRRVCEDLSENKRRGRRLLPVSVNFSLYEFYAPGFLNDLTEILDSFDLDPKYIEVEITESTSQANSFLAISYLKKIKERGLQILMDDFGTGYSNIANLCKLPIDKVKIDKSLVDNLVEDLKTQESVRYLINLCSVNGLESIAEGVDNVKQVEILKKLKCDTIQGYYYSRPISKEAFDNFLIENTFEKRRGGNKK